MSSQKDYSKSPAPNFDAVEDVRSAMGESTWERWREYIDKNTTNYKYPLAWNRLCDTANVTHPFQRQAWYDHHFGQGAWEKINAEKKS